MTHQESEAIKWFKGLKPAFKNSVYEDYLDIAIKKILGAEEDSLERDNLYRSIYYFEKEVPARILGVFRHAGIHIIKDFQYLSRDDVSKIFGCGEKMGGEVFAFAAANGVPIGNMPKLNKPFFKLGETIVTTVDKNYAYKDRKKTSRAIHAGSKLVVFRIETSKNSSFTLPTYICEDDEGYKVYLSPGEIEKLDTIKEEETYE